MSDYVLYVILDQSSTAPNDPEAWFAVVQDTGVKLPFIGDDTQAQEQSVQALADIMNEYGDNIPVFTDRMGGLFDLPDGMDADTAFGLLFRETNQMYYGQGVIYSIAEDSEAEELAEVLVELGEAFLIALA